MNFLFAGRWAYNRWGSCWHPPFQSGFVIGPLCSALSISVPGVTSQSNHRFSRGRTLRYNNRDRPAQTPYWGVLFATCKFNAPINSKLQHLPPGIPRAFDCASCPRRGEFEHCVGRVGNLNRIYLLFWRNRSVNFFGFCRVWRIYKIEFRLC